MTDVTIDGGGAAAGADGAGAADKGSAAGADKTILGSGGAAGAGADAAGAAAAADKGAAADGAAADKGATDDWRVRLAGDDKDFLKTLGRYSDEAAFGKAHRALHQKLSSGEYRRAAPENASAEELATWRKENGLPENEAGYIEKLELPKGMVLGEEDKPVVGEFAKAALASNVDPKQFSGLVSKYYEMQDQKRAEQETRDAEFKQQSEEDLRNSWKQDYRSNLTAVSNMLAGWPEDFVETLLTGRTADGRLIGDNPVFLKQMAALARELNPMAPLVPMGTTDPAKTVDAELEEIRNIRRNKPDEYDANRAKYEAREVELIDARLKVQKRQAA